MVSVAAGGVLSAATAAGGVGAGGGGLGVGVPGTTDVLVDGAAPGAATSGCTGCAMAGKDVSRPIKAIEYPTLWGARINISFYGAGSRDVFFAADPAIC
jgi:hypothetical protein